MKRILAAMSGGVDSTVAALLMKEAGYEVSGVTLKMLRDDPGEAADAKRAADRLGIAFSVEDASDLFREKVMRYFADSYLRGDIPNPCVVCNPNVKFKVMTDLCEKLGADAVVTGHYARVGFDPETGRYAVSKAVCAEKDQSYMLCGLSQYTLSKTLFPLGNMTKTEVRRIAAEFGFENAEKKDSQDVCFIKDGDYVRFIKDFAGIKTGDGDFLDKDGNVIGRHHGALGYTIGQRRGFGMGFGRRIYVTGKDMEKNTVTLSDEDELFVRRVTAYSVNFVSVGDVTAPVRVVAKTRYRQKEQAATLYRTGEDEITAEFDEPVRAVAPGQTLAAYVGDVLICGGTIRKSEK